MRKRLLLFTISFLLLILFSIWNDRRIVVTEQSLESDGVKGEPVVILQISDLHNREFGRNQSRLLQQINEQEYDILLITGDVLQDPFSTDWSAFHTLLDGIEKKEHAYYIQGNTDPSSYDEAGEKSVFIMEMEARGVSLLESEEVIDINGTTVAIRSFEWSLVAAESSVEKRTDVLTRYSYSDEAMLERLSAMEPADPEKADVIISVTHYPVVDAKWDTLLGDPELMLPGHTLLLAGHYHGGQIRLPFYGALFVPEQWERGVLPPRDRVKGLWEYRGQAQYVSAGLGASRAIPFLSFRFFNPPEINLLTIESKN